MIEKQKKFVSIICNVMDVYHREIKKNVIGFFWEILKEFELKDIENAFFNHIKDMDIGRYAPTPSDILRKLQPSYDESSIRCISLIKSAAEIYGSSFEVIFKDSYLNSVISDVGGWGEVFKNKDDKFFISDLKKIYVEKVKNGIKCINNNAISSNKEILFGLSRDDLSDEINIIDKKIEELEQRIENEDKNMTRIFMLSNQMEGTECEILKSEQSKIIEDIYRDKSYLTRLSEKKKKELSLIC